MHPYEECDRDGAVRVCVWVKCPAPGACRRSAVSVRSNGTDKARPKPTDWKGLLSLSGFGDFHRSALCWSCYGLPLCRSISGPQSQTHAAFSFRISAHSYLRRQVDRDQARMRLDSAKRLKSYKRNWIINSVSLKVAVRTHSHFCFPF